MATFIFFARILFETLYYNSYIVIDVVSASGLWLSVEGLPAVWYPFKSIKRMDKRRAYEDQVREILEELGLKIHSKHPIVSRPDLMEPKVLKSGKVLDIQKSVEEGYRLLTEQCPVDTSESESEEIISHSLIFFVRLVIDGMAKNVYIILNPAAPVKKYWMSIEGKRARVYHRENETQIDSKIDYSEQVKQILTEDGWKISRKSTNVVGRPDLRSPKTLESGKVLDLRKSIEEGLRIMTTLEDEIKEADTIAFNKLLSDAGYKDNIPLDTQDECED